MDVSEFLSLQSLDTPSNLIHTEALLQGEKEPSLSSSFSRGREELMMAMLPSGLETGRMKKSAV
jgi:hypothetical protein